MLEHLLHLPRGTEVEVRAPVFEIYGEDWEHVFEQVRLQGYRRVRIDGALKDLGGHLELGEDAHPWVEAVIDRFVIGPGIDRQVLASLEHGLKVGDGFLSFHPERTSPEALEEVLEGFRLRRTSSALGDAAPRQFHLQRSGRRVPHLRRVGHLQARSPDAAGARSQPHPGRRRDRQGSLQSRQKRLGRPLAAQPGATLWVPPRRPFRRAVRSRSKI